MTKVPVEMALPVGDTRSNPIFDRCCFFVSGELAFVRAMLRSWR